MIDKVFKFLSSTRLAIFLLIFLTVVSVIGIIIPQELPAFQYIHKLGAMAGKILLLLGLDHIFSTVWFYALLGMLSVNLGACILTRLIKNFNRSMAKTFLTSPQEIDGFKHHFSFSTAQSVKTATENILLALKTKSFGFKVDEATSQICAKKGFLREIGSLVFHFSIILLFIGGLIGKFGGFSQQKELRNGEIAAVPDRPFLVRSDGFKIETNEKGEIKDYKTKLTLLNPDSSVILGKVIEVNAPLSYQGVRFYQASYGKESERIESVRLRITGMEGDSLAYEGSFPLGAPVTLPDQGLTLEVKRFLGDFVMDTDAKQPYSRSKEHDNPAVQVVMTGKGGEPLLEQWAFQNFPNVHMSKGKYQVSFVDYTPLYYAGIQIKHTPGMALIWMGILLMTFGIFAMFYLSKQAVWIFIKETSDGSSVISIGGSSGSLPSSFNREFHEICRTLQKTVEKGGK
jgi:cytochrome c biogenesis protein